MFDRLFMLHSKKERFPLNPNYTAMDALATKSFINSAAPKLVVLFPPWHGSKPLTAILSKRLVREGYAVLRYEFDTQILTADKDSVLASFAYIQQTIAQDLRELPLTNYTTVRFIGLSLGSVALAMVADAFPGFHEADLIVAGDDLVQCLWYGERTTSLRQAFECKKVSIQELSTVWHSLAPGTW